jgi:hypothetical protein
VGPAALFFSFLSPGLTLLTAPPHQRSAHSRVRATPGRGGRLRPRHWHGRQAKRLHPGSARPPFPFYPLLSTRIRARQPYPCLHVGDHTLASNRHPSVTLLPLPRLARASNPPGEAPAARHRASGDFPLWILCSPPGGEKGEERRRGKGEEESARTSPSCRLAGVRDPKAGAGRVAEEAVHARVETEAEELVASPSSPRRRHRELHHRGLHGHVFTSAST